MGRAPDALQRARQLRWFIVLYLQHGLGSDQPSRGFRHAVQTFDTRAQYQLRRILRQDAGGRVEGAGLGVEPVGLDRRCDRQVNAAVKPGMSAADANKERQKAMSEIEQASKDKTGLRSDVVTLYGGARYHLYRYKQYTDVRLVWAPEAGTAFFGGDADNFEYPRYCLDVTIFRVYENDKPAKIDNFLAVNPDGAKEGDLVFVSGNPGTTRAHSDGRCDGVSTRLSLAQDVGLAAPQRELDSAIRAGWTGTSSSWSR